MSSKKVAVILSGCGVYDGAEIHESAATLYAIAQLRGTYQVFAPDIEQHHVINHLTGEEMQEKRNVLIEAARIARGNVLPLTKFEAKEYDALILPGGFGVAKNLSSLALDGSNLVVLPQLESAVKSMFEAKKPIGALCIAPAVISKILTGATLTIGSDEGTITSIESLGGQHVETTHGEIVVDEKFKLVTTPCYMLDANIIQVFDGTMQAVQAVLNLI